MLLWRDKISIGSGVAEFSCGHARTTNLRTEMATKMKSDAKILKGKEGGCKFFFIFIESDAFMQPKTRFLPTLKRYFVIMSHYPIQLESTRLCPRWIALLEQSMFPLTLRTPFQRPLPKKFSSPSLRGVNWRRNSTVRYHAYDFADSEPSRQEKQFFLLLIKRTLNASLLTESPNWK